jgi:predicted dehydrogenase
MLVDQELRVIQVGAGSFGKSWAGIVNTAPGIQLVAIAEPFEAARDRVRADLDGWTGSLHLSLDDALARAETDAVLVITPPDTHHDIVTRALTAGKHVLVEKPLATTIEDATDLIATADAAGRTLMVSQNYRYRRPIRTAQKVIADGRLGDLISIRIDFQRDTRTLFGEGNFRYSMRHPLVLDMSIHHFDLLRAITGQDVRRIDARSWHIPDSPYAHDPAAAALIELESGATVVYEGNWATHTAQTSWNGDWDIIGMAGRLTLIGGATDASTGELALATWSQAPELVKQVEVAFVDRAGTLDAFREAISSGNEPETVARDNIRSLAAVLSCVESIERDEAVDVTGLLEKTRASVKH